MPPRARARLPRESAEPPAAARESSAVRAPRSSLEANITVASDTESHVLHLHDFEKLSKQVGEKVEGPDFEVGCEKFCLWVFPGGDEEKNKGHVGVFLAYRGSKDGVAARFAISATHSADATAGLPRLVFPPANIPAMFATRSDAAKKWDRSWGHPTLIPHTHLVGLSGCLSITVEVTVHGTPTATPVQRVAPSRVVLPPRSIGGDWLALLTSGTLSDVTLRPSSGPDLRAHKAVLAARSPVFAAMFTQGMAEADSTEVTLGDLSSAVLRRLVHYLYAEEPSDDAFEDAEGLLAAADQYQLPRLVALCERELCGRVEVETAARLLLLADRHHAAQLKEHTLEFIGERPAEVMASEGWQLLGTEPNLLQELFAHRAGVRKRPVATASGPGSDDEGGAPGSKKKRKRKTTRSAA